MGNVVKLQQKYSNTVSKVSKDLVMAMRAVEYKHSNLLHYIDRKLEDRALTALRNKNVLGMEKAIKELKSLE